MQSEPGSKKKPYSPPAITSLSLEQAKQFVSRRTNCCDSEATDFLESLRREQQQPKQLRSRRAQNRIEKLPILVKLNAENAVRMMVEKLVALNVSEKEIVEAIQHLTHEDERKAVVALSKRRPSTG